MSTSDRPLAETLDRAEAAFWAAVAECTPSATSGGFPPGTSAEIREPMCAAIELWRRSSARDPAESRRHEVANAAAAAQLLAEAARPHLCGVSTGGVSSLADDLEAAVERLSTLALADGGARPATLPEDFERGPDPYAYGVVEERVCRVAIGIEHRMYSVRWTQLPAGWTSLPSTWAAVPHEDLEPGDRVRCFPEDQFIRKVTGGVH